MTKVIAYKKGEVIFHKGEEADAFYVVRSGKVSINNGDAVLDEVSRNGFFGEMAFLDQGTRSATAVAVEHSECVRISAEEFNKRLSAMDPVMQGMFRVLVERLRHMNQLINK
jgi:CRP/FNR family transcriptional regulator, cyclic AMP receptor protein